MFNFPSSKLCYDGNLSKQDESCAKTTWLISTIVNPVVRHHPSSWIIRDIRVTSQPGSNENCSRPYFHVCKPETRFLWIFPYSIERQHFVKHTTKVWAEKKVSSCFIVFPEKKVSSCLPWLWRQLIKQGIKKRWRITGLLFHVVFHKIRLVHAKICNCDFYCQCPLIFLKVCTVQDKGYFFSNSILSKNSI